ncbi:MAG: hypothetical protein CMQ34_09450 [Gammaproteobacteria bacterium]|nr:hypothetical protein [Gammaproteobacteria bacterium]|tara:strand:- start:2320 stop:2742 length:423 start_codon:yes stop_codon:yes gene_type:complete
MTRRSTFLTAAFLALWLPAQALATVLAHCVSLDAQPVQAMSELASNHALHMSAPSVTGEDCHGQTMAVSGSTHHPSDPHSDSAECVHCTGGCHKLQSMLVFERDCQRFPPDTGDQATSATELATGYPDMLIRPPIDILST